MNERRLLLLCFSVLFFSSAYGKLEPIKDVDLRYQHYHVVYNVNADYTQEQKYSWSTKVLSKRAIKSLQRITVSYSASVEEIDILEAYNTKSNGDKIDAPKTNYQVQSNSGRNKNAPVFSDRVRITVVFPDVEVGDTLSFSYKRTVKEPMFPGYFAEAISFSKARIYDDVLIKLVVPSTFSGLHQSREMDEKITHSDSQSIYEWRWNNKTAMRDTRKDYSVWDMEVSPGFSYSTFKTYREIAEAYGKRALPKAKVSDEVRILAKSIVGSEVDPKKQARLLYEWVATKISYAGNCVGVGAVVPHDISFILENRMGDCKDHATLLHALLMSKGIKSNQALINSGSVYDLPDIPSVTSVNHVLNYLPEYDLFIDSTSPETPFGMLPLSVQGKPVLLVEDYIEGLKTPSVKPGANKQEMTAIIDIQSNGALKGEVDVRLYGEPAVSARSGWRNISQDSEEKWLEEISTRNGKIGSASMEKDDPKPLLKNYSYSIDTTTSEFLLTDSAGGFRVSSPVPTYFSVRDLLSVPEQIEEHDIACSNGSSYEKFRYKFPKNFKILDIPKSLKIEGKHLKYKVKYTLRKNILNVERSFEDSTPGPICSPALIGEQMKTLQKISRSLRSQVVYKPLDEGE